MCFEAKCLNCGKTGWQGCGRHVAAVYSRIPDGQHCQCKPWPGVKSAEKSAAGSGATATATATADSKAASSCTVV